VHCHYAEFFFKLFLLDFARFKGLQMNFTSEIDWGSHAFFFLCTGLYNVYIVSPATIILFVGAFFRGLVVWVG